MNRIFVIVFVLVLHLVAYADSYKLGIYGGIGMTNIDFPGNGKNPNFTFAFDVGASVAKNLCPFLDIGSGIRFQKTGYLQKNGFFINDTKPIDSGITDYRIIIPIEVQLYPKQSHPLFLITGIENSFLLKRVKIIKPKEGDYSIKSGLSSLYNINFEIGIGGDLQKALTVAILYKRGLNAIYREVEGFNLNMITINLSWWFHTF